MKRKLLILFLTPRSVIGHDKNQLCLCDLRKKQTLSSTKGDDFSRKWIRQITREKR